MFISRKNVAKRLGRSVSTVKRLMERDPYFPRPWKRNRTIRFKDEDVEKYIKFLENKGQADKES